MRHRVCKMTIQERDSHIFPRDDHDHYVEPEWVSERLFEEEEFDGPILDPACGWGRILRSADKCGFKIMGSDVVDRKPDIPEFRHLDFVATQEQAIYRWWAQAGSIVCNPPFELIKEFTHRACVIMRGDQSLKSNVTKVAMICLVRRLPAASWLKELPLCKVLMMTPRPSMPTAAHILVGGKVGGGQQDFAWLIFKRGYRGHASIGWLRREGYRHEYFGHKKRTS
jgi:hypothetical protein